MINQSAEGAGGLGFIRGNKVGDSNVELQICTVIIMTKKKQQHKNKKKYVKKISCDSHDSNPGYMGSNSTKISNTLWRPMHLVDKNNQYMLKL